MIQSNVVPPVVIYSGCHRVLVVTKHLNHFLVDLQLCVRRSTWRLTAIQIRCTLGKQAAFSSSLCSIFRATFRKLFDFDLRLSAVSSKSSSSSFRSSILSMILSLPGIRRPPKVEKRSNDRLGQSVDSDSFDNLFCLLQFRFYFVKCFLIKCFFFQVCHFLCFIVACVILFLPVWFDPWPWDSRFKVEGFKYIVIFWKYRFSNRSRSFQINRSCTGWISLIF